jgi:catalase
VQLIDEDRAAKLGFDLLDPTKLVPEEWCRSCRWAGWC